MAGPSLGLIRPNDAVVERVEQARRILGELCVDSAQLPAVLLPTHVDRLADQALIEHGAGCGVSVGDGAQ